MDSPTLTTPHEHAPPAEPPAARATRLEPRPRDAEPTDARLFYSSLAASWRRAPLWITTWLATLGLALPVAMAWHGWFVSALGHAYEPASQLHSLDEAFRFDHRAGLSALGDATGRAGAILAFVALLVGVFSAGGWLQVHLERTHGHPLRRFFYGGSRYFFRFLRVAVLALLVLAAWRWLLYGMPWERWVLGAWLDIPARDATDLETLDSELTARAIGWAQDGAFALVFVAVAAWAIFTRTRLALHDTSSALWAGAASLFTILRHPIRTLRPLALLAAVEIAVVVGIAGSLSRLVDSDLGGPGASAWHVLALALLGQLALLWREITRGARYHAAVAVSRDVIRPLPRPDPWRSIGAPGGPQYPVDGDDDDQDYGFAL